MITKGELEKFRTPQELKTFFDALIQKITKDRNAKKEYRLNKGIYKYIKTELYPLVFFATQHYNDNHLIRPLIGNQGYDAEIKIGNKIVYNIELTWAVDGEKSHKIAQQLNKQGYTEVKILSENRKQKYKERCIKNMKKKAQKDYSDSILVIVYDTDPTFSIDSKEDQKVLEELAKEAKTIPFKAKKVFLFLLPIEIQGTLGDKKFGPISLEIKHQSSRDDSEKSCQITS